MISLTLSAEFLDVTENLVVAAGAERRDTLTLDITNPVARSIAHSNGERIRLRRQRDGANQGSWDTEKQDDMGHKDQNRRLEVGHLEDSNRWTCSENLRMKSANL